MASAIRSSSTSENASGLKKGNVAAATPSQPSSKPKRPNYRHIHRFPLPIETHPLPLLIPHNPLSWATIALTYLLQVLSPPQRKKYSAYFDPLTSSVHVTDPDTIRALWEMGFFGKGSLSRSEPSWLEREKKRLGLVAGSTAEEVTRARRNERREMKLERARKEREAIALQLKIEAERKAAAAAAVAAGKSASSPSSPDELAAEETVVEEIGNRSSSDMEVTSAVCNTEGASTTVAGEEDEDVGVIGAGPAQTTEPSSASAVEEKSITIERLLQTEQQPAAEEDVELQNQEHLQLSLEEAFFLVYGLGVLNVYNGFSMDPSSMSSSSSSPPPTVLSASSLFSLFRGHSYFPARGGNDASLPNSPDDAFITSYVVYHHFRSLGWVVRSGVKFGVDYILYNRGPVFSHAEFAVVILPSYSDAYWSENEERRAYVSRRTERSWWWLHCVNRVQAQVKKTLVLCYVEIPRPPPSSRDDVVIGEQLKAYRVREFTIRRWVPNRTRD